MILKLCFVKHKETILTTLFIHCFTSVKLKNQYQKVVFIYNTQIIELRQEILKLKSNTDVLEIN